MKQYRVEFGRLASRTLFRLAPDVQRRLLTAIELLQTQPRPPRAVKLQGHEQLFRIRVGDYRIIYEIHDDVLVVLIVQLGHRRHVYRGL